MKFLITAAIVILAFRVLDHYWLNSLLGGYVISGFVPIALLFCALMLLLLVGRRSHPGFRRLAFVWTTLFLYVTLATLSLVVHEPNLDAFIQKFGYLWGPVLIFVSLLWLPSFGTDKAIRGCVKVLTVTGFLFALYAMYSSTTFDASAVPPMLETNYGERYYFTTYEAGFRDASTIRWTVPGLNTSHFAPMLLPLAFLGMLMARQARGLTRVAYLVATAVFALTIAEALSRGAMIPLIVGVCYLAYVKWYPRFGKLAAGAALVLLLLTQPIMYARIVMTIGSAFPFQDKVAAWAGDSKLLAPFMDAPYLKEEHFLTNAYTIQMMLAKPLLGYGWTNFTEKQAGDLSDLSGKDHNNYLSIGAAFGLPALMFYVSFLIGLGLGLRKIVRRSVPGSDVWQSAHIWAATLIGYALCLIGAPAEFHFVWVWFGLIGAWSRNQLMRRADVCRTTSA